MLDTIQETTEAVEKAPTSRQPHAIKCNYCLHVTMAEE